MKIQQLLIYFALLLGIVFSSCESNDSPMINATPPLPNVPVLLAPENNSTISTLAPLFDWTNISSATTYQIQISRNSSFGNLILDTSGLTTSQYTSSNNMLSDSSSYYWRVRGIKLMDTTQWSTTHSFTTSLESINPTNKVLIELFTNTSCIPCVEPNQYLDEIFELHGITSNDASVVILRIHTTLFAGDPFYLYNTTDNNARMAFYPNSAIVNPRTFLLGTFIGNYSPSAWTNKINEKLGSTRTFAINLVNTYDTISRNGNITIKIKQVSGVVINDLVYHVAVSENEIQYIAPNGETHFNNTLRNLVTPPGGQGFSISSGQTNNYTLNYSIDPIINQNKTDIVVFVQRISTKEVLAAEEVKIK